MNNEIQQMWQIFPVGSDSVLELRALQPSGTEKMQAPVKKHFHLSEFNSVAECESAFEQEALRLNAAGCNIYTTLNPIKPSFQDNAVTDTDIEYRDLLLIAIGGAICSPKIPTPGEMRALIILATKCNREVYRKPEK